MIDFFKRIKFLNIIGSIPEMIILVCAFPVWFPVTCYKYGLVYSDNLIKKYIE